MKLLFKQRFFSWFDSYDIYDEDGNTVFTVEGKLAWGHCLHILNAAGEHIGMHCNRCCECSQPERPTRRPSGECRRHLQ